MKANKGFTLVEFIVVGVIFLIIATVAVPNFVAMAGRSATTSASNELLNIVQSAKIESIRARSDVVVCASSDGEDCDGNWRHVILFVDKNGDETVNGTESVRRVVSLDAIAGNLQAQTLDDSIVVFDRLGMLKGASGSGVELVSFCSTLYPKETKSIVVGMSETSIVKAQSNQSSCP